MPADWYAGVRPPKGWDCADAIEDGWTLDEMTKWMKSVVSDTLSPYRLRDGEVPFKAAGLRPAPDSRPAHHAPVQQASTLQQEAYDAAKHDLPDTPNHGQGQIVEIGAAAVGRMQAVDGVQWGSEVELARIFAYQLSKSCGGKVVKADGSFWAFGPTDWQPIDDQKLRLAVHLFDGVKSGPKALPLKVGKRTIDGVITETGTILSSLGFFNSPAIGLNALNAVITVDEGGVVGTRSHDPDDRFRFTIQAEFHLHTDMTPPEGSFLHKLLFGAFCGDPDAGDKINLVGEILGAAAFGLATRLPQPKAFVFLGETASNGKSTIASLLSCLLPEGSVSSIPPGAFADERRIVNLAGKAANVADELSASAIAGETFKAAITGQPLEGRDLYRSAITFRPRAIHVFTTNTLPRFNGGLDRGLQRRLLVLPFNRPIAEKEIIPDIADRIKRDELDLLLGFAISGAQRLARNRGYTIPQSSVDALNGWLLLDPVNEWFDARVRRTTSEPYDGWLTTGKLFADFKRWAIEQGHGDRFLPPVNTFSQRLKAMPGVEIKRRSRGSIATGIDLVDQF